MEHRLLSDVDRSPNLSPKSMAAVLSLIVNPFTSEDQSLSFLLETLCLHLRDAEANNQRALSLLSAISQLYPRLRQRVAAAAHAFVYLPSASASSLPHALSLLDPSDSTLSDPFSDESLFLSLCFWQCTRIRRWVLRNVSKFRLRPSLLLTVLLGFTKDPFPYIRKDALNGLAMLSNGVVVEDRVLVERCYFRAAELLFDAESSVRGAAVRAVSEWGQLLVTLHPDNIKGDWSDTLFVQLCLMVRDMDMEIRVTAFNALGNIQTVSEDILLQTLSKKALAATKDKKFPGHYTAKLCKIPATAAAFAFVHGLEDEFYQVRTSACHALQRLVVLSSKFAVGAIDRLMDMLNDDVMIVRLQALAVLHHIAMHDHLMVEESHLHMFLGALVDNNALIRSAARKTLQLTKLQKLAMFRLCMDGLIKNLELYPQDEADIFYVLYKIGQTHGKFVVTIIREVSELLEPSSDGKLGSNEVRRAALLVLAISAPVSHERQICSIPPQIYSYAVTLLGRLSCGLVNVTDQSTLLAYLSQCSKFTVASASENFEGEMQSLHLKDNRIELSKKNDGDSLLFHDSIELKKVTTPLLDYLGNASAICYVLLRKFVDLWPLLQLGRVNVVVGTLRSWKEGLRRIFQDSWKPAGVMVFTLKYIHVIKLLGKAWAYLYPERSSRFKGMGLLGALLGKLERMLKEMLYRFVSLSGQEKLHILELMLVTYIFNVSYGGTYCFNDCMKKMNNVLCHVERLQKQGSLQISDFVIELQNTISSEISNTNDGPVQKFLQLKDLLDHFTLKCFELTGELNYMDAELDVCNNDFQNPLPFISGLPVGIPVDITLYNISAETRLWLAIALSENYTQFVFLDLDEFGGPDDIRKFTFVSPFYRTPKVKHFSLKVSVVMECLFEDKKSEHRNGPKHELIPLCKGKEVHLFTAVK